MVEGIEMSEGRVKLHNIYACYNCPREISWNCTYRRRSKTMSNMDQWINCKLIQMRSVETQKVLWYLTSAMFLGSAAEGSSYCVAGVSIAFILEFVAARLNNNLPVMNLNSVPPLTIFLLPVYISTLHCRKIHRKVLLIFSQRLLRLDRLIVLPVTHWSLELVTPPIHKALTLRFPLLIRFLYRSVQHIRGKQCEDASSLRYNQVIGIPATKWLRLLQIRYNRNNPFSKDRRGDDRSYRYLRYRG